MSVMLPSGSLSRMGEGQGEGESKFDYRFCPAKFISEEEGRQWLEQTG